jgi:hypothetical protein
MNDIAELVGTRWRHLKTNHIYNIVGFATAENNMEDTILYREVGSAHTWSRPYKQFMDGRFRRIRERKK